ncbi:hypothetical protein PNA2_1883 [Pyrococcus sp. NA2]|uniref:hypothetical protein n=1 Tax=Pyrococcus sp. (strain NA2) TaxID=342949 RepID=UPI000209ACEE|nr:hypothetical protein [Pyrococcus sp. NA2]AEC52796.1 hypothetical protein PNA2_1883 [Pyrococcus sp. NA2]
MKYETMISLLFGTSVFLTLIFKDYSFLVIPSIGIPIILAYLGRRENLFAKSPLFDRDTVTIVLLIIAIVIVFNLFTDPRLGLLSLGLFIPVIFSLKE